MLWNEEKLICENVCHAQNCNPIGLLLTFVVPNGKLLGHETSYSFQEVYCKN